MTEHRKPFSDVGLVAAFLAVAAWIAGWIVPSTGAGAYGNALMLLSAPCFLLQVLLDQKQIRMMSGQDLGSSDGASDTSPDRPPSESADPE